MANKDEIVYECGPSEPEEIIEERPEGEQSREGLIILF